MQRLHNLQTIKYHVQWMQIITMKHSFSHSLILLILKLNEHESIHINLMKNIFYCMPKTQIMYGSPGIEHIFA